MVTPAYDRWIEVMTNARRLLSKPGKWSQSTMNLDKRGLPCSVEEAVQYSLIGALEWGLDDPNELYAVCSYLCRVAGVKGNLHDWHRGIEASGDTVVRADVIKLLDRAIMATQRKLVANG
jgi:hypothetical protein